ncbi:MAG TPA: RDD family protein [Bacteroidia bacterium]|jgi:uncharacterized RDD family membrane protein YckC
MASIEIVTSQNVPIEYELAGLRDRALAFLLDFVVIVGGIILLRVVFLIAGVRDYDTWQYLDFFIFLPIFFFYTLCMEIFNDGQSVGKLALRIKVVKLNGSEVTLSDYFIRWMFRMVDIYFSLGSIASMLVGSSEKGQRMGDIVANTTVIRLQPKHIMTLSDLLRIGTLDSYTPKFPEVKKLTEEDMLVVKSVIERYSKFPNRAHREALELAAKTIAQQIGITKIPANRTEFLKVVLRDYVVLTR